MTRPRKPNADQPAQPVNGRTPNTEADPSPEAAEPSLDGAQLAAFDGLVLGAPFALVADCDPLQRDDANGIVGCVATLKCGVCDQPMLVDLLKPGVKNCPGCGEPYTHVLVICRVDDADMATDVLTHIARVNGFQEGPGDDDDEAELEEDDDEEEDEEEEEDEDGQGEPAR